MRHSKGAAWRQIRRFIRNSRAFLKDYDRLAASYRERYDGLTSEDYWQNKLRLTPVTKIQQDAAE